MDRFIKADSLKRKWIFRGKDGKPYRDAIDAMPSEDVAPVVHGEWVKDEEKSKKLIESIYICSACHNFEAWGETEKYNYCPNCGAKMDAERREDEQIH